MSREITVTEKNTTVGPQIKLLGLGYFNGTPCSPRVRSDLNDKKRLTDALAQERESFAQLESDFQVINRKSVTACKLKGLSNKIISFFRTFRANS